MKTPTEYWQAINAATLAGLDHFAAALLAMYCREWPEGPQPQAKPTPPTPC